MLSPHKLYIRVINVYYVKYNITYSLSKLSVGGPHQYVHKKDELISASFYDNHKPWPVFAHLIEINYWPKSILDLSDKFG